MEWDGVQRAHTLPRLLSQAEKGETITITKRGRPVAILTPAQRQPQRDIRTVIEESRAYSQQHTRSRGPVSLREIREMTEKGRP
jgi:antitoxin (DNA-binding transcriptional repressor) of toxin-antitoxin stability system